MGRHHLLNGRGGSFVPEPLPVRLGVPDVDVAQLRASDSLFGPPSGNRALGDKIVPDAGSLIRRSRPYS